MISWTNPYTTNTGRAKIIFILDLWTKYSKRINTLYSFESKITSSSTHKKNSSNNTTICPIANYNTNSLSDIIKYLSQLFVVQYWPSYALLSRIEINYTQVYCQKIASRIWLGHEPNRERGPKRWTLKIKKTEEKKLTRNFLLPQGPQRVPKIHDYH